MIKHRISVCLLLSLGVLLMAAALLKAHELLTLPTANKDLWSYRPFLILQVECELALGLWLLSGLWKRAAWWIALLCFGLFSGITLTKALTGAASCGCFGRIQVNPWITLLAIDVPAVLLLLLFRIKKRTVSHLPFPGCQRGYMFSMGLLWVTLLGVTTVGLITHVPQKVTAAFEVLEPQTWTGRTLPILPHVDIADRLEQGNWLIMLFHHDCPDCAKALPEFQQMADSFAGNEDTLQLALVEVPPLGYDTHDTAESNRLLGRMDETKKWLVVTPAVLLLTDGRVRLAWEPGTLPTFELVLEQIAEMSQ
ncbi:MAG: hypothetical protein K9N55_03010 [Phycisphaerae bacterium]|nr:hypothetical protein [Phycisphaerae bacterium]